MSVCWTQERAGSGGAWSRVDGCGVDMVGGTETVRALLQGRRGARECGRKDCADGVRVLLTVGLNPLPGQVTSGRSLYQQLALLIWQLC